MNTQHDLEVLLMSRIPLLVIESGEERRVLDLIKRACLNVQTMLFSWKITEGLQREDPDYSPQRHNSEPDKVLAHIAAAKARAVYVLLDFHAHFNDSVLVRRLKDIVISARETGTTVVLLSHQITLPGELLHYSGRFELALPDDIETRRIVMEVADSRTRELASGRVSIDQNSLDQVVSNLQGMTALDVRRLARNLVYDDDAITHSDLPGLMKAKYQLLKNDGLLSFEPDTANYADVAGMQRLKNWLQQRKQTFLYPDKTPGLDPSRGVLLLGVQGCGKSLAAKAVAGMFGVGLLRLDFGSLYNKYHGETERNLRESLKMAEMMAPCVMWIDEIEKGLSVGTEDGGTSNRVLGTLLTWMAERTAPVFMVATANNIKALPAELVRKGRFDEIFFVDLPQDDIRAEILQIHLQKRGHDAALFDLDALASHSEGFTGAELEQAVVSALYASYAQGVPLATGLIESELKNTRPLSVVMSEQISALRQWALERTVPAG
jgi:ATP-dependent 26S proteasome regulatory subunit